MIVSGSYRDGIHSIINRHTVLSLQLLKYKTNTLLTRSLSEIT